MRPGPGSRAGGPAPGGRTAARALLALLALAAPRAVALDPARPVAQYVTDTWKMEQGLPQMSVQAILQARDGYLWLGTQEGLVRFDGVRFAVWTKRGTDGGLGHSWVQALHEDGHGLLWAATAGGGVSRMSGGTLTRFAAPDGLSDNTVTAVAEDGSGTVWVGTEGGGLTRFTGEPPRPGAVSLALPSPRVTALVPDGAGGLWVGTDAGLCRLVSGRLAGTLSSRDGLPADGVTALARDRAGRLLVGTERGLARVAGDTVSRVPGVDPGRVIRALLEDRDGNVWVGTGGGGVTRIAPGGAIERLTTREGLASDEIWAFAEDREGSLWIGTETGGLVRLRDGKFRYVTTRDGLPDNVAVSIYEDRSGAVWIGTEGGLGRLAGGRMTAFTRASGLVDDHVSSTVEDRRGTLWVATRFGGLSRIAGGKVVSSLTTRDGLPTNSIRGVWEDRSGTIRIGTRGGGLVELSDGKLKRLTTRDGLPSDLVWVVAEDRDGTLWVGTDHGLGRIRGGRVDAIGLPDGLPHERIGTILPAADGTLWLGTDGGGLVRYRDGRFAAVTARDGLLEDSLFALVEDGLGSLWMTSNRGIFRARLKDLDAVADGRAERVTCVPFGTADGMRSAECNGGANPPALRSRDGRLWFPTVEGVAIIDPARVKRNEVPPPVVVEGLAVDGRPLPLPASGPLVIAPGHERFEIRFTALSLLAPRAVRFRYRLEGYDPDWSEAAGERVAHYTHLPPGAYTFRVIACNNDGLWNETGASLSFRLEPRFTQTVWFYLLAAVAVGGLAVAAHRRRVRNLQERERELVRIVEERTQSLRQERAESERLRLAAEEASRTKSAFLAAMSHELRTPLNAVLGFVQLMQRERGRSPRDVEHLGIISRSGAHLLGLINDVLSLSKIEAGLVTVASAPFDLPGLLGGVEEILGERAAARGLELVFEPSPRLPRTVTGDEGKLRQVLLNLLGNAVKFTERGRVRLGASWADGTATFVVEDTGPGLSEEEQRRLFAPFVQGGAGQRAGEGTGLGLAISRDTVRLMGGDLTVASAPGHGAVFTVTVPLPAAPGETAPGPRPRQRVAGLAPGRRTPRLLVVDDVADSRLLVSRMLGAVGFDVLEAADGAEAVRLWERERPDLVLMDRNLPVLDGLAATRAIRAAEAAEGAKAGQPVAARAATRIVGLSASAFEHEREGVVREGCDGFLAKPVREDELLETVAAALGVTYLYEEQEDGADRGPLTAADLARLPAAAARRLREALEAGDDAEASAVASAFSASEPRLAAALLGEIRACRFDELLVLLGDGAPGAPRP